MLHKFVSMQHIVWVKIHVGNIQTFHLWQMWWMHNIATSYRMNNCIVFRSNNFYYIKLELM